MGDKSRQCWKKICISEPSVCPSLGIAMLHAMLAMLYYKMGDCLSFSE